MRSTEVKLTHPNDRLEEIVKQERHYAMLDRKTAVELERSATEVFQRAAQVRLSALKHDQVADRIAGLLPPTAPSNLRGSTDGCSQQAKEGDKFVTLSSTRGAPTPPHSCGDY